MEFTNQEKAVAMLILAHIMYTNEICAREAFSNKYDDERRNYFYGEGIVGERAEALLQVEPSQLIED